MEDIEDKTKELFPNKSDEKMLEETEKKEKVKFKKEMDKKKMIKVTDSSTLNEGNGAQCNICNKKGEKDEVFWFCEEQKSEEHPNGYNLCKHCYDCYAKNAGETFIKYHRISNHQWIGDITGWNNNEIRQIQ